MSIEQVHTPFSLYIDDNINPSLGQGKTEEGVGNKNPLFFPGNDIIPWDDQPTNYCFLPFSSVFSRAQQVQFPCWALGGRPPPCLPEGFTPRTPRPQFLHLCNTWYLFCGCVLQWRCVLFSELKTQRRGSVDHFWAWNLEILEVHTMFGANNSRSWKCLPFSDLKTQGPGSVRDFRNWKLKALEVIIVRWNWGREVQRANPPRQADGIWGARGPPMAGGVIGVDSQWIWADDTISAGGWGRVDWQVQ